MLLRLEGGEMKTFEGDNGHWKFCLKCGTAEGTGHLKSCKYFIDYKDKYIKARKQIRELKSLLLSI